MGCGRLQRTPFGRTFAGREEFFLTRMSSEKMIKNAAKRRNNSKQKDRSKWNGPFLSVAGQPVLPLKNQVIQIRPRNGQRVCVHAVSSIQNAGYPPVYAFCREKCVILRGTNWKVSISRSARRAHGTWPACPPRPVPSPQEAFPRRAEQRRLSARCRHSGCRGQTRHF